MLARAFFAASLLVAAPLHGQDEPPKYPVETNTFNIKLTSDEGPVAGASVRLYACRCEEDRGSHYGWPRQNTDVPTEYTSDENGMVALQYPVKFGSPENWKTLCQISMLIRHAEFVPDEIHIDPREGMTTKELKAGCELSVSAIDSDRKPVEFGVILAGPGRGAKWIREEGFVRSRAIPDGTWQTMLVSPREDGRHLFSSVLPVRLRDQQNVRFRNLELRPGLRVIGQLSDDVPRPVRWGRIQAYCVPEPTGEERDRENPSVSWNANTKINDEGTFEFSSLPRSGKLQLIAICEGWVGVDQDIPKQVGSFKQGMFLDLDDMQVDDQGAVEVLVPMERTGSLTVTVRKPDGSPLAGATVSTNPNEYIWQGGSTILGANRSMIETIKNQISGSDVESRRSQRDEEIPVYSAVTDEKGQAKLSGIPCQRNYSVGAYHDDYIMPAADRGRRQRESYSCEPNKETVVTIEMHAIKTTD